MPVLDTILLVDDDDTTNFLHLRLLNRLQVADNINVAANGDEALQYLKLHCLNREEPTGNCPHLVFLDIKMPVMDGIEFLEQYEKIESTFKKHIRIIILSSSMNPKDTERIKKFESVQRHYTKPLSEDIVNEIITQYF